MEITYIAHSCFKIKTKNQTIVIDPYDPQKTGYKLPKLSADILMISHDHFDHNFKESVTDVQLLVDGAGEYEKDDTFIYGIKTFHDDKKGAERGSNTIYLIEAEGFSLLHLGDLGHELEKETLENIPAIDVLFIPVGGKYTINAATAAKVISSIEPSYVIPMHYQTKQPTPLSKELALLETFLDEMGSDANGSLQEHDALKLSKRSDLPNDTEVFVLKPIF
jgi:L-ascorbate metabolism protein UlaG (beta-lactamase superfamily)